MSHAKRLLTPAVFVAFTLSTMLAFSQNSLEILVPVGAASQSDYSNNLSAMIADSSVTGATITIYWSDFDCGSAGCNGSQYDFTITDAAFTPWEGSNGKKINIVLQMISNGAGGSTCPSSGVGSRGESGVGNCAMPPWVWAMLGSTNYSYGNACGGTNGNQQIPNYFNSQFQAAYKNAIVALIDHYAHSLSTGQFTGDYIRVALGHGGEILPSPQWSTTSCLDVLNPWAGLPQNDTSEQFVAAWVADWLKRMVSFMGGKNFNGGTSTTPMQIMGAITPMGTTTGGCTGCEVPDDMAPAYVNSKMGFGSQGLQISDVYSTTGTADWIELFNTNKNSGVPLELQTFGQSCPGGVAACNSDTYSCTVNGTRYNNQSAASCTGSLATLSSPFVEGLLPFAASKYATIFEVYYEDWNLGNISGFCTAPGGTTEYCYSSYGTSYDRALDNNF